LGQRLAKYLVLFLEIGILWAAGYIGALISPRFHLSAAAEMGLMILAAGTGISAFFSPCSFPQLISVLGSEGESRSSERQSRVRESIRLAAGFSIGVCLFLFLSGGLIAWVGGALFRTIAYTGTTSRVIRSGVGALLIMLGLIQTNAIIVDFRVLPGITGDCCVPRQASDWTIRQQGVCCLGLGMCWPDSGEPDPYWPGWPVTHLSLERAAQLFWHLG